MMQNKYLKKHLKLNFKFDFSLKSCTCFYLIKELFNYTFKDFKTRYDYIAYRNNLYGGRHDDDIVYHHHDLVYSIDLVSIKEEVLKEKSSWLEEFLNLLFKENSFKLSKAIFEKEKKLLLTTLENYYVDPFFIARNNLLKMALNIEDYYSIFPFQIAEIKKITPDDLLYYLNNLKSHLFKVDYLGYTLEEQEEINRLLPNYVAQKITLNYINVKNNIFKSEYDQRINSSVYLVLYSFPQEKYYLFSNILSAYFENVLSFLFQILREKYALLYSYNVYYQNNTNFLIFELPIEYRNKNLAKKIIADFFLKPTFYLTKKTFIKFKKEFLSSLIVHQNNQEVIFKYNSSQIFAKDLISLDNYIKQIKSLTYIDMISMIKEMNFLGEYFLRSEKDA